MDRFRNAPGVAIASAQRLAAYKAWTETAGALSLFCQSDSHLLLPYGDRLWRLATKRRSAFGGRAFD